MLDPVLFAAEVDAHRSVAELFEPSRDDLGVLASPAAVDDDWCVDVGKQGGYEAVDLVGRDVDRRFEQRAVGRAEDKVAVAVGGSAVPVGGAVSRMGSGESVIVALGVSVGVLTCSVLAMGGTVGVCPVGID